MFIGKVVGALVSTQKEPTVANAKLLVVEALNAPASSVGAFTASGRVLVAVDFLGATTDEIVLVTQGSSARMTATTKTMPVDAIVVGIVDAVQFADGVLSKSDGTLTATASD